jgi:hypothetical protein
VRWHSRFKAEYHTLRDAKAAKAKYEASGKILWPDDLRIKDAKPETPTRTFEPAAEIPHMNALPGYGTILEKMGHFTEEICNWLSTSVPKNVRR